MPKEISNISLPERKDRPGILRTITVVSQSSLYKHTGKRHKYALVKDLSEVY